MHPVWNMHRKLPGRKKGQPECQKIHARSRHTRQTRPALTERAMELHNMQRLRSPLPKRPEPLRIPDRHPQHGSRRRTSCNHHPRRAGKHIQKRQPMDKNPQQTLRMGTRPKPEAHFTRRRHPFLRRVHISLRPESAKRAQKPRKML